MVVHRLLVVVVLVGVATAYGYSDRGAERATEVLEAEELAVAALLTEANMPPLGWALVRATDPPDRSSLRNGALARRTEFFIVEDSLGSGDPRGVTLTVTVYGSVQQAQSAAEKQQQRSAIATASSDSFRDALAANLQADAADVRSEEPLYELADAEGVRRLMTVTKSDGTTESVWETHTFARGRIVASYTATGEDRRSLDHQALLEKFEARVAAHGGG